MALVLQGVVVVGLLISLHPVLAALPGFWAMRIGNRIAASSFDETAERRRVAERLFESATDLGAAAEIRLSKLDGELCRRHDAAWASLNRTIQRAEFTASAVQGGG